MVALCSPQLEPLLCWSGRSLGCLSAWGSAIENWTNFGPALEPVVFGDWLLEPFGDWLLEPVVFGDCLLVAAFSGDWLLEPVVFDCLLVAGFSCLAFGYQVLRNQGQAVCVVFLVVFWANGQRPALQLNIYEKSRLVMS